MQSRNYSPSQMPKEIAFFFVHRHSRIESQLFATLNTSDDLLQALTQLTRIVTTLLHQQHRFCVAWYDQIEANIDLSRNRQQPSIHQVARTHAHGGKQQRSLCCILQTIEEQQHHSAVLRSWVGAYRGLGPGRHLLPEAGADRRSGPLGGMRPAEVSTNRVSVLDTLGFVVPTSHHEVRWCWSASSGPSPGGTWGLGSDSRGWLDPSQRAGVWGGRGPRTPAQSVFSAISCAAVLLTS